MPTAYERTMRAARADVLKVRNAAEHEIGAHFATVTARLTTPYKAFAARYAAERARLLADAQAKAEDGESATQPHVSQSWLLSPHGGNLAALQGETRDTMHTFARQSYSAVQRAHRGAVVAGDSKAQQMVLAALKPIVHLMPPDFWRPANRAGLSALERQAEAGGPLDRLFQTFGPNAGRELRTTLAAGMAGGVHPSVLARDMVNVINSGNGGSYSRAVTIARTTVIRAWHDAALENYRANSDVVGGWIWMADKGSACAACLAMDGTQHTLDEDIDGHPNCFVAGTVVASSRVRASTTRWFDGEVVEIETAGGRHITVTENHPILTPEGWIAAGLLHEGSDVLCCSDAERVARTVDPNDYQVPSLIEDVAATCGEPRRVIVRRVPTTAEDFHGDGSGSKVSIVRADGSLQSAVYAALTEPALQHTLCLRHMVLSRLVRLGALDLFGKGMRAITGSLLSLTHTRLPGGDAVAFMGQPISSQSPAPFHTGHVQAEINSGPGNAIRLGKRIRRLASDVAAHNLISGEARLCLDGSTLLVNADTAACGEVAPESTFTECVAQALFGNVEPPRGTLATLASLIGADRVLKVSRRRFRGHVYNLQTTTGWYTANTIIAHNCKCARGPVTKSYADILESFGIDTSGMDLPDPPWASYQSGADWLDDQDAATQRAAFGGQAAYSAWKSGDADLRDFAAVSSSKWGDSIQVASLKSMGLDASDYADAD